jgi:hypothetical protein
MVIICGIEGEDHGPKTCLSSLRDRDEKMEDPSVFDMEFGLSVGVLQ